MEDKEIVITPEGYEKLTRELRVLTDQKRREIARRIRESLQFGDLTENSEYSDAKDEQAFVEGRILKLTETLSRATIVKKRGGRKIGIGSRVVLKDLESGEKTEYTVVGSVEADPSKHRISNQSPVGRAIMGKESGDTVSVKVLQGRFEYQVVRVKN